MISSQWPFAPQLLPPQLHPQLEGGRCCKQGTSVGGLEAGVMCTLFPGGLSSRLGQSECRRWVVVRCCCHSLGRESSCWQRSDIPQQVCKAGRRLCPVSLQKRLRTQRPFKMQGTSSRALACVLDANTSVPLLQTRVLVPSHTHLPTCTFTGRCHLPFLPFRLQFCHCQGLS